MTRLETNSELGTMIATLSFARTHAYLELVRHAVRANTSFENLPVFVESNQSAARTQSELRWKGKTPLSKFSFAVFDWL